MGVIRIVSIVVLGASAHAMQVTNRFTIPGQLIPSRREAATAITCRESNRDSDDDKRRTDDWVQTFLDTPLIRPTEIDENESTFMRQFKSLLRSDYEMAEALYAGAVMALLLLFAQQAVRIYKHCYVLPDNACPWDVATGLDHLSTF